MIWVTNWLKPDPNDLSLSHHVETLTTTRCSFILQKKKTWLQPRTKRRSVPLASMAHAWLRRWRKKSKRRRIFCSSHSSKRKERAQRRRLRRKRTQTERRGCRGRWRTKRRGCLGKSQSQRKKRKRGHLLCLVYQWTIGWVGVRSVMPVQCVLTSSATRSFTWQRRMTGRKVLASYVARTHLLLIVRRRAALTLSARCLWLQVLWWVWGSRSIPHLPSSDSVFNWMKRIL